MPNTNTDIFLQRSGSKTQEKGKHLSVYEKNPEHYINASRALIIQ